MEPTNIHPPTVHPAGPKTLSQIKNEWDAIANIRAEQIDSRRDLSFHLVLLPTIERLARNADWSRILDAGCGTGFLTQRLSQHAGHVVGADLSTSSINLARTNHSASNVTYVRSSLEAFASRPNASDFSLIVANMTLMTAPNLGTFLHAAASLLRPGGSFVFTITHPCFWPAYWGYDTAPWFDYNKEQAIEAPFTISLETSDVITTHFHRPLERYVTALGHVGLSVLELDESLPKYRERTRYPVAWRFPRFLAGRAERRHFIDGLTAT